MIRLGIHLIRVMDWTQWWPVVWLCVIPVSPYQSFIQPCPTLSCMLSSKYSNSVQSKTHLPHHTKHTKIILPLKRAFWAGQHRVPCKYCMYSVFVYISTVVLVIMFLLVLWILPRLCLIALFFYIKYQCEKIGEILMPENYHGLWESYNSLNFIVYQHSIIVHPDSCFQTSTRQFIDSSIW